MTVGELISILGAFPSDWTVVVDGGLEDVEDDGDRFVRTVLDVNARPGFKVVALTLDVDAGEIDAA